MEKLVNVVIKDGNRIVNWDFAPSETIESVLKRWGFQWEPNSVVVCGLPLDDNMLDKPLSKSIYVTSAIGQYTGRLFIKMKQPQKPKKEGDANVG